MLWREAGDHLVLGRGALHSESLAQSFQLLFVLRQSLLLFGTHGFQHGMCAEQGFMHLRELRGQCFPQLLLMVLEGETMLGQSLSKDLPLLLDVFTKRSNMLLQLLLTDPELGLFNWNAHEVEPSFLPRNHCSGINDGREFGEVTGANLSRALIESDSVPANRELPRGNPAPNRDILSRSSSSGIGNGQPIIFWPCERIDLLFVFCSVFCHHRFLL